MSHGAARCITRSPALAGAGVWGVPISAQRAAVDPRIGDRVDDLLSRATQHRCYDCSGGHTHEDDVIQSDTIEAVLEREHTLDLVRFDHAGQYIAYLWRCLALHDGLAREIVRNREYAAQTVGRMSPLRCEPGVVEIEPADHCADVEGRLDGVQLE